VQNEVSHDKFKNALHALTISNEELGSKKIKSNIEKKEKESKFLARDLELLADALTAFRYVDVGQFTPAFRDVDVRQFTPSFQSEQDDFYDCDDEDSNQEANQQAAQNAEMERKEAETNRKFTFRLEEAKRKQEEAEQKALQQAALEAYRKEHQDAALEAYRKEHQDAALKAQEDAALQQAAARDAAAREAYRKEQEDAAAREAYRKEQEDATLQQAAARDAAALEAYRKEQEDAAAREAYRKEQEDAAAREEAAREAAARNAEDIHQYAVESIQKLYDAAKDKKIHRNNDPFQKMGKVLATYEAYQDEREKPASTDTHLNILSDYYKDAMIALQNHLETTKNAVLIRLFTADVADVMRIAVDVACASFP
jgi:hypothetical protein